MEKEGKIQTRPFLPLVNLFKALGHEETGARALGGGDFLLAALGHFPTLGTATGLQLRAAALASTPLAELHSPSQQAAGSPGATAPSSRWGRPNLCQTSGCLPVSMYRAPTVCRKVWTQQPTKQKIPQPQEIDLLDWAESLKTKIKK